MERRKGSEKKSKARGDQEKKSWNKKSLEKGHETKQREENTIFTKKEQRTQKKTKNTVEKKKRNQWKQENKKKQEKEWDGLLQRMTRGRCPCHCDHRTNNCQWKMRKESKPGGAKYFLREKHEVFSNKNCTKGNFFKKNGVWKFVLFLKSKKWGSREGIWTNREHKQRFIDHKKGDVVFPFFSKKKRVFLYVESR